VIGVIAEIAHLVVHRHAGDVEHTADDHAAGLTAGVRVDGLHHVGNSHRNSRCIGLFLDKLIILETAIRAAEEC
jgi:hypothetical protein